MTVTSTVFVTDWFTADGVNRNWPVNFAVFDLASVIVEIAYTEEEKTAPQEITGNIQLVPTAEDFSSSYVVYPSSGTAVASGVFLRIKREVPFTQPTEIGEEGDFSPRIHEQLFDKLTMMAQQLDRRIDELAGIVTGNEDWPDPPEEDSKIIQWNPTKFGAVGGGADDWAYLQNALDFLAENTEGSVHKDFAYCELDLGGRVWTTSKQLVVHGPVGIARSLFLKIKNGGIKAHSSFAPQANGGIAPIPLLLFKDGGYGAILENVYIDCNKKCSGICIVPASSTTRHVHIKHCTIRRFFNPPKPTEDTINTGGEQPPLPSTNPYRPYGIRIGTLDTFVDSPPSSMCTLENNNISQWDNSDAEGDDWNKCTGIGISLHAIDSKVRFNAIDSLQKAICVKGWNNEISFNHPSPPNPGVYDVDHSTDRIANIEVEQYGNNRIIGNYVDNGYIILYQMNQIITDNFFSWNPDSTFANSSGLAFVATSAGQAVFDNDTIIANNLLMNTLSNMYTYIERAPFGFTDKIGNAQVSQLVEMNYRQKTIGRAGIGSSPLKLITGGVSSFIEFLGAAGTTQTVLFGARSNNLVANLNGNDVFQWGVTEHNSKGLPIIQAPWKFVNDNAGRAIVAADDGSWITNNGAGPSDYLLPTNAPQGMKVGFAKRNGAVTITPAANAQLNGGTSAKTLTINLGCIATCMWNGDGSHAEWTLIGTFT
jgi:hypothetical protein